MWPRNERNHILYRAYGDPHFPRIEVWTFGLWAISCFLINKETCGLNILVSISGVTVPPIKVSTLGNTQTLLAVH